MAVVPKCNILVLAESIALFANVFRKILPLTPHSRYLGELESPMWRRAKLSYNPQRFRRGHIASLYTVVTDISNTNKLLLLIVGFLVKHFLNHVITLLVTIFYKSQFATPLRKPRPVWAQVRISWVGPPRAAVVEPAGCTSRNNSSPGTATHHTAGSTSWLWTAQCRGWNKLCSAQL